MHSNAAMSCIVTRHLVDDHKFMIISQRQLRARAISNKIRSWIMFERRLMFERKMFRCGSVVFAMMFARARTRASLGVARPTFERYEGRVADRESLPLQRLSVATVTVAFRFHECVVHRKWETFSYIRWHSIARLQTTRKFATQSDALSMREKTSNFQCPIYEDRGKTTTWLQL